MTSLYNENDAYPAQWTRNLMAAGLIPRGVVDERSIEDVRPCDLDGFSQCHFFAGISVWPRAFRLAGVPDDILAWSGSCPCQGFSVAGQGRGFADERHLWPAWFHLIRQRRPAIVFGEQVSSPLAAAWLDLVQADLEGIGYACGAVVAPAAGFGAPHGRHRTWFVAYALPTGRSEWRSLAGRRQVAGVCGPRVVVVGHDARLEGWGGATERSGERLARANGMAGELADAASGLASDGELQRSGQHGLQSQMRIGTGAVEYAESEQARVSRFARERRATGGFWGDCDWISCRGGKWRPIEPGTFPLAHGVRNRVGKLRAYGNAIVLPQAVEFVKAGMAALMEVMS